MHAFSQRIALLIVKYLRGELSTEENAELCRWLNESAANQSLFDQLIQEDVLQNELQEYSKGKADTWEKISMAIDGDKMSKLRSVRSWRNIAAAAAILIILSTGIYIWAARHSRSGTQDIASTIPGMLNDDRMPGRDKATLTLSDGSVVILDSTQNGTLAVEKGMRVMKLENGQLEYQSATINEKNNSKEFKDLPYNTIVTPRGGKYMVVLSDGTKVWLNAASSISYPVVFTGPERKVSITGEVYFEVAPLYSKSGQGKVPFIVKKDDMQVTVLGTHFNINSYENESELKVTLLEGLVKVSSTAGVRPVFIKPGQQARIASQKSSPIVIENEVNTDEIMAWKNGLFQFNSTDIESLMKQVERWYDVNVEYENEIPTDRFSGKISRQANLSKLLKILELSGIHFRLEQGNKLIVTKK